MQLFCSSEILDTRDGAKERNHRGSTGSIGKSRRRVYRRGDYCPPRVNTLPSMELTARRNLAAVRSRANIHIRVDRSTCPVSRRRKRRTRLQRFLARQFQIKSSRIRIRLCPILSVSKGDDIDENDKSSLESMAKKIYLRAEGGRTKDADSMSNLSRRNKPIRRGRKKKRKRQT